MTNPKKTRKDDNEPATKGFVREALDDAVDDLAQITNSAFAKMATKDDLKVIETDVGTLKTDVGTLKTDVGTLKTDVGTLKTDVGTLNDYVEGLSAGQDRIERRLDGLMDTLDENNQLLKGLPERVERLEQKPFPHR